MFPDLGSSPYKSKKIGESKEDQKEEETSFNISSESTDSPFVFSAKFGEEFYPNVSFGSPAFESVQSPSESPIFVFGQNVIGETKKMAPNSYKAESKTRGWKPSSPSRKTNLFGEGTSESSKIENNSESNNAEESSWKFEFVDKAKNAPNSNLNIPTPKVEVASFAYGSANNSMMVDKRASQILEEVASMFDNLLAFPDAKVVIGEKSFYFHRCILSKRCPSLLPLILKAERKVDEQLKEQIYVLENFGHNFSACRQFFRYFYCREVNKIEREDVLDFLSLCGEYNPEMFAEGVHEALISVENVVEVSVEAKKKNSVFLQEMCFDFILFNFSAVSRSPQFARLDKEILTEIIARASMKIQHK